MQLHNFVPNLFIGPAIVGDSNYVTSVQEYRCNRCGETVSLPDCGHATCRHLLSHGCKGKMEKVAWKSPMKSKAVYEDKKEYPAKRKGNEAKKRVKQKGVRS
jgi:hypothetical protein